ncbi:MAG: hydroxymethylglutaryl-CoA reductase [Verrucomicrobiota bacterium]
MGAPKHIAEKIREELLAGHDPRERLKLIAPRLPSREPLPPRLPTGNDHTEQGLEHRRKMLSEQGIKTDQLAGKGKEFGPADVAGNIENFIGFARIPVGVIGPLRINGSSARGDFYVPMATTEGALVASYHRGAYVISQSGGCAVLCLTESVSRSPCFMFRKLSDAALFLNWVLPQVEALQAEVRKTSKHCTLVDMRTSLIGKELYLGFEYRTGDAAGQNMVTIATDAVCQYLVRNAPVKPVHWVVEGNLSGDKKATMLAFLYVRGKKVVAEVVIRRDLLKRVMHVTPEEMVRHWQISMLGAVQSGSIGTQAHFANALAAIFIACGQDAACVAEASVGLTRMDVTDQGDFYISVAMPNLIVGSVGGGTRFPTARECLEMIGSCGEGKARQLAEICAATALAGEISIVAAMAAGEFKSAHERYGRKRR